MSSHLNVGNASPVLVGPLREKLRNFIKASTPGGENPICAVWWIAFLYWGCEITLRAAVLLVLHAWRGEGAPAPQELLPALLYETPLAGQILSLVMAYLFITEVRRRPFFGTLGWGSSVPASPAMSAARSGRSFVTDLMPGLVGAAVVIVIGRALTFVPGPKTVGDAHLESSVAVAQALALTAVVMAPFAEEVVYRGIVYGAFSKAFGKLFAFLPTLAFFTLVHWDQCCDGQGNPNWGRVLTIVVLSLVCTTLRARTGRIAPAYFAHLGYNSYLAAVQFVDYDPVWLLMQKLVG